MARYLETGFLYLRNGIHNGLRDLAGEFPRYWRFWEYCVRQLRIFETLTRGQHIATIRQLQLRNFDATWLLAGAPKGRLAAWDVSPALKGVGLLRGQCAQCIVADENSGPSKPGNGPKWTPSAPFSSLKTKPPNLTDKHSAAQNSGSWCAFRETSKN